MDAKINIGLVAGMDVAAAIAQFCPSKAFLDATCGHNDRSNAMLAAFMIKRIAGPKFDQANEPGTIDGLRLLARSDKCSDRKAREVIARKKSLIGEVPIDVEVCLRAIAFIQEKLNLPLGFPFALLGRVPVFARRTWIVDDFAGRIALLGRRLVKLAPAPECLIEALRCGSSDVFQPGLRIPMRLGELGSTGGDYLAKGIESFFREPCSVNLSCSAKSSRTG